ncbi:MAG: helix-turn-helix transcriptional regulator [Gemmatimonas sp.]
MSAQQRPAAHQNNALAMIDRLFGVEPGWADAVARAEVDCRVAEAIFALRERHGLTQKSLAAQARTTQSVVARLEDADYTGHSLRMLVRIATAVGERLKVSFVADAASRRSYVARRKRKKDKE